MKELARQFDLWPVLVLISGMTLVFPVPRETAADEVSLNSEVGSESDIDSEIRELQALLTRQTSQLGEQQKRITSQQEEIDKQRELFRSVQAQLDQLAGDQTTDRSPENAGQPQQSVGLDELIATQPESTRLGEDFTGSIPIPGTEAAVKIGGFAKMSIVDTLDPLGCFQIRA